jgi:hypothetical protein
MIALCRKHADQADTKAFTDDQLREMKSRGRDGSGQLGERFNWMRTRLLAIVGGALYYDCPVPIEVQGVDVIRFGRDADGHFLLNFQMPTLVPERRMQIVDNFWIEEADPEDLQCPPSGRLVYAKYGNSDLVRVEFLEIDSVAALTKRYRYAETAGTTLEEEIPGVFPVTAVDIRMKVMTPDGRPAIDFDSQKIRIGGITMLGALMMRSRVGIVIS